VRLIFVNVKCAGEATGSATIEIVDGKAPFSYAWSNGSNKEAIKEIGAGNYTVTITDSKNCSVIEQVHIEEPAPITATHQTSFSDCKTAAVTINIQGGTAPYTWTCDGQERPATIAVKQQLRLVQ